MSKVRVDPYTLFPPDRSPRFVQLSAMLKPVLNGGFEMPFVLEVERVIPDPPGAVRWNPLPPEDR